MLWPRCGIDATGAAPAVAETKTEETGLEADGATIRTTGAAPSEAIGSNWISWGTSFMADQRRMESSQAESEAERARTRAGSAAARSRDSPGSADKS